MVTIFTIVVKVNLVNLWGKNMIFFIIWLRKYSGRIDYKNQRVLSLQIPIVYSSIAMCMHIVYDNKVYTYTIVQLYVNFPCEIFVISTENKIWVP